MLSEPTVPTAPSAPESTARAAPREARLSRALRWRIAWTNLPFALTLAFGGDLPAPIETLCIGAVLFFFPGLAWTDRRVGDAALVLYRAMVASFGAALLALLGAMALPGPTSRSLFLLGLALITNLGLWRGARRGFYDATPFATPLAHALTLASALFFAQSYLGAAYFVPALEDQDMEVQGTAYGLVHTLAPTMTTNDESRYYFAHPLLLHVLIGESLLVSGDLERLRYYHAGSLAMGDPPHDDEEAKSEWYERSMLRWNADYARFLADPLLLPTRTPNIFLAASLLFFLGFLAYRMTGSNSAALIACAVYATLPEIYVRSAYGGYMAIANFLTLAGSYFYLCASGLLPVRDSALPEPRLARRNAFGAAFLGGWADQKVVLLPAAVGLHVLLRVFSSPARFDLRRVASRLDVRAGLLVGGGFVAGWATYIGFGTWTSPRSFYERHIRGHFLDRIQMDDLNLKDVAEGDWVYPSILALWQEFSSHAGWLLVALAVPALALAARRMRDADGVFFLWVAIAAVGFSLVDWRQTKHLAQFLPAFALLIGVLWASSSERRAWWLVMSAALCAAIVWNITRIGLLMHDFEYIAPLPIW